MFELPNNNIQAKVNDSYEREDTDIEIEDVTEIKTSKPMFTKKGKMTLAVISLGLFVYYLWNKRNATPEQVAPAPSVTPSTEVKVETPSEAIVEEI